MNEGQGTIRLDKWLWAARFFRTRTLATAAVIAHQVRVNGVRAKPSREVRIGDCLEIVREDERYLIVVRALAGKRGSVRAAQRLYAETVTGRAARLQHAALRKLASLASPAPATRPDKRSRRLIHRFKQGR